MKLKEIVSKLREVFGDETVIDKNKMLNKKCFEMGKLAFVANGLFRYLAYVKVYDKYIICGVLQNTTDENGNSFNEFEYYDVFKSNNRLFSRIDNSYRMIKNCFEEKK